MFGISERLADVRFWERVRFPNRLTRDLTWGIFIGIAVSLSSTSAASLFQGWRRKKAIARIPPRPIELRSEEIVDGVIGLIGAIENIGEGIRVLAEIENRQYPADKDQLAERCPWSRDSSEYRSVAVAWRELITEQGKCEVGQSMKGREWSSSLGSS